MSEWKEYKLGEVTEVTSAKRIFYSEYMPTGVPFYRSKEIIDLYNNREVTTELFISEERFNEIEKKYGAPQVNDILITSVGSLGIPYIVKENDRFYFKDGNLTWIKSIDTNRLLPQYLKNWIISSIGKQKLDEITIGSTQPALTISGLKSMSLKLPPIEEQKRIAGVLSSLDDKIDLLNRENATLEALAETLFRHYFIENPNPAWKEGKLGELIEVKYGKDHKKLGDGSIPVIGSGGIMRYANKALFDGESVLIPRKGSLDNVMYIDEPFWTVDTMFYTKMKIPHVAKFVYQYMKTLDLVNMNVGSAVPSMTADVLNNILLEIPSQTTLDDYERIVTPFYKKTKSNQQQMQTLTTQRDALLPRLMSGEVKVGGQ